MVKTPNFFLGIMRVAAWLFWRDPVAKSEPASPKPPRKPILGYTVGPLPDEIHSIVRLTWFKNGRVIEVDQFQLDESPDATEAFQYTVGQALRNGLDVCVLTTYPPEALGVPSHE